jgi:UDP:flavonoid glycosyltransferase YjiC (YdhE family)
MAPEASLASINAASRTGAFDVRVLFTSRSSISHLKPMLPLAQAAQAAGHEVRFATGAEVASTPINLGFPTEIVGVNAGPAILEALQTERPPPSEIRRIVFTRFFAKKELEPRLSGIEATCRSHRPDIIVHGLAELAAPLAGALAGIPVVTVGYGPLLEPDVAEAAALAAEPFWRARGLTPPRWAGLYRELYVDPCPPSLQIRAIDQLPAVQKMGQAGPASHGPPEWLSTIKAPLVYMTFGTIFNRDQKLIRRVLEALEKLPVEIVATVGENNDPAAFGPRPTTTRVFRFVPQESLLPYCRAAVCHAGGGTVLGALAAGVPMLLLPQSADQFYNASRASAAGTAIALMPDDAGADAIATSVARLLDEPGFAERARAVRLEMAAMPSPEEAWARIERLSPLAAAIAAEER